MADDEGKKEEGKGQASDEGDPDAKTSDGDKGDDGSGKKKLEESSQTELISYIKELRTESKGRREEITALKTKLDGADSGSADLKARLKELEDKEKSDEEKQAERVTELEAAAGKLPELEKYQKHVKAVYGERIKALKEMDEAIQSSIDSLLEDMPKDDFLGRLKIIDAVLAVSGGKKPEMKVEDTGNPAETGDGESGKTMANDLAWSGQGSREAELAGLIKKPSSE